MDKIIIEKYFCDLFYKGKPIQAFSYTGRTLIIYQNGKENIIDASNSEVFIGKRKLN